MIVFTPSAWIHKADVCVNSDLSHSAQEADRSDYDVPGHFHCDNNCPSKPPQSRIVQKRHLGLMCTPSSQHKSISPELSTSWYFSSCFKPYRTTVCKHMLLNWGRFTRLPGFEPLVLCLCRRWVTHFGGQLLPISDGQLTIGQHVTDIAMSQQSEGTGLSKQLVQGTPCIHGKSTVCVRSCTVAFSEKIRSGILFKTGSQLLCQLMPQRSGVQHWVDSILGLNSLKIRTPAALLSVGSKISFGVTCCSSACLEPSSSSHFSSCIAQACRSFLRGGIHPP